MSSIEKNLEHKVFDFLNNNKIPAGSTLVVGLSGGPDSTALLLSLCSYSEQFNFRILAAYINHGMRESAQLKNDDSFVRDLTDRLKIELFTLKIQPGEILDVSIEQGRSSEEVARSYRYRFFNEILERNINSYLLLGHNLDDQFETILMRFLQGSGITGLKGIPHKNQSILRPLINCRKKEILKYLSDKNQMFRIDPSNDENNYLRNNVRNRLLPLVEEIFPGYEKSLKIQEKRFTDLEDLINKEISLLNCSYNDGSCSVLLDDYNSAHDQIRISLLFKMFDYCYDGLIKGFRIRERFFQAVLSKKIEKNRVYAKGHGIQIYSDKNSLIVASVNNIQSGYFFIINDSSLIIDNLFRLCIGANQKIRIEKSSNSPLIIRSFSDGDFIEISGKNLSIKEIFKKWNVKNTDKNIIPILVDSEGIIAVLGEFWGYKNIIRNKKINIGEKFNILYLGIGTI